jgi:hypothetical protein
MIALPRLFRLVVFRRAALAVFLAWVGGSDVARGQQPDSVARRVTADSTRADTNLLTKILTLEATATVLQAAVARTEARRQAAVDSVTRQLKNKDTVILARLAALETQHAKDAEAEAASVKFRLGVARTVLGEMNKGVVFITFTQNAVDLEQTDMLLKNFWSASGLRNAWDRVETWGTVAGGAAALVGLTRSGDAKLNTVGASVGAIAVARLVGHAFGKDRADKINEVAQRIAISRRAYDALSIRNGELRAYVQANRSFRARLQRFQDSLDLARSRGDSLLVIARIGPILDEYAQITSQIPSYIDGIIITNRQHVASYEALANVLSPVTRKAEQLQAEYKTDVLPVLQYANRLRALLEPEVVRSLDDRDRERKARETP